MLRASTDCDSSPAASPNLSPVNFSPLSSLSEFSNSSPPTDDNWLQNFRQAEEQAVRERVLREIEPIVVKPKAVEAKVYHELQNVKITKGVKQVEERVKSPAKDYPGALGGSIMTTPRLPRRPTRFRIARSYRTIRMLVHTLQEELIALENLVNEQENAKQPVRRRLEF